MSTSLKPQQLATGDPCHLSVVPGARASLSADRLNRKAARSEALTAETLRQAELPGAWQRARPWVDGGRSKAVSVLIEGDVYKLLWNVAKCSLFWL